MIRNEHNYEFRRRLEQVHKPDRRNFGLTPDENEIAIDSEWYIVIPVNPSPFLLDLAVDLQDYLLVSMKVSVRILLEEYIVDYGRKHERVIILTEGYEVPELRIGLDKPRSYRLLVETERIWIVGFDERGIAQGSYFLEDLMNLREAPYVKQQELLRKPLFSPRMAHSGWGLDCYPEAHLNAMAHAGIDAILLFVSGMNLTPEGVVDFNYVIDRAEKYGLDVYMYSYLISKLHPDDAGAEAHYESTYGKVMEACPRFKGIILVGESCEFPSKDPNTTGVLRLDWPKDKLANKPSPGWWPCIDYPQWLTLIQKIARKYNPEVEIVFWTYNWGWAPEEDRLDLIRNLPQDITLQVTFEMFEQIHYAQATNVCVDYTASFSGPGSYFTSEAKVANERGIKLYTMSNTGGLTWDIGVIPYEPIPYQWAQRHAALIQSQKQWGLSGLMESHHYGWWPSFISEMTKWAYWTESPSTEEILVALANRDFGELAAELVVDAWKDWSEGIRWYVPTNEDQYGPFRVGPSYPLVFLRQVQMPDKEHSLFGNEIVVTDYKPMEGPRQSPGIQRIASEIERLTEMERLWRSGNEKLVAALEQTPQNKYDDGERMLGISRFIAHSVRTTIHVKQWWLLKQQLFMEVVPEAAEHLLEQMIVVAQAEIVNAENTIPLVQRDSRLGWEPSMDYMTDEAHLVWKVEQVKSVLSDELVNYRKSLFVHK